MTTQDSKETVYFKLPVFFVDALIHILVMYCVFEILPHSRVGIVKEVTDGLGLNAMLVVSYTAAIAIIGLRLHERKIKPMVVIWRAIMQTVTTYVLFTAVVAMTYKIIPRHLIVTQFAFSLPLIVVAHYVFNKSVRWIRHIGHNVRHVVMIGADETAMRLYQEMGYGQSFTGYKVMGFFSSLHDVKLPEGAELLGTVQDFFTWIENNHPDEIYCSLPPASCSKDVNKIIQVCNDHFINFYFVPTMDGYPHRHMAIHNFGQVAIISLREEPMNNVWAKMFKRTFDIVVSGIFLCTLYPIVHIFVWIGTTISSPGPIFFRQERTGYNGKSFRIFKFRSMKVNADSDKVQATKDDPRKTKFGDFLRKSSIDELPQFINVFLGDMSIIGPRPHMEYHTEIYSELIGNYMVRHLAKPGITGWAQISGCRGETKTVEEMKDRVEHDIWYIEHWTPLLDLEIFFKTMWQVLPGNDKQAY